MADAERCWYCPAVFEVSEEKHRHMRSEHPDEHSDYLAKVNDDMIRVRWYTPLDPLVHHRLTRAHARHTTRSTP